LQRSKIEETNWEREREKAIFFIYKWQGEIERWYNKHRPICIIYAQSWVAKVTALSARICNLVFLNPLGFACSGFSHKAVLWLEQIVNSASVVLQSNILQATAGLRHSGHASIHKTICINMPAVSNACSFYRWRVLKRSKHNVHHKQLITWGLALPFACVTTALLVFASNGTLAKQGIDGWKCQGPKTKIEKYRFLKQSWFWHPK